MAGLPASSVEQIYSSFTQLPPDLQQAVIAQMGVRYGSDVGNAAQVLAANPALAGQLMRSVGINMGAPAEMDGGQGLRDNLNWMDGAIARAGGPSAQAQMPSSQGAGEGGPPLPPRRPTSADGAPSGAPAKQASAEGDMLPPLARGQGVKGVAMPPEQMDVPAMARAPQEGSRALEAQDAADARLAAGSKMQVEAENRIKAPPTQEEMAGMNEPYARIIRQALSGGKQVAGGMYDMFADAVGAGGNAAAKIAQGARSSAQASSRDASAAEEAREAAAKRLRGKRGSSNERVSAEKERSTQEDE
jgi:hypothetical protein